MLRGFLSLLVVLLLALHSSAAASLTTTVTENSYSISVEIPPNTAGTSTISVTGGSNSVSKHLSVSCHDHCSKLMVYSACSPVPSLNEPARSFGNFNRASASVSRLLRPPRQENTRGVNTSAGSSLPVE